MNKIFTSKKGIVPIVLLGIVLTFFGLSSNLTNAQTTSEDADWTTAWMMNETGETSSTFSDILVNVTSVEIREVDGKQYQCITASGIPNYQTTITQQIINALLARPLFATDFANGINISVGDVVNFGEDIGYTPTAGCVSGNEGSGYWPTGPACPVDIEKDQCFPMDPEPTEDICLTDLNDIGTWVNGVAVFNWQDGMSYQNEGVWVNEAFHFEYHDLDIIPGHAPPGGNYHHHSNPGSLGEQLGDEGLEHSPIYGFAADGYPIYGPWHAEGELANSCWKARDYDDPASLTGCGVAGERSCLLVDQYDITQGVESSSSNGPNTYDIVSSASGNPFVAASGYYFQDYYYDSTCSEEGVAFLDKHNGHDHDGLGYHYHVTIADNGDGTYEDKFPFYAGPSYYGVLDSNAIAQCGSDDDSGAPGGGPPGDGNGGPPGDGNDGPPDDGNDGPPNDDSDVPSDDDNDGVPAVGDVSDAAGFDASLFFDGALANDITIEDCTLSDGTQTTCYEITIVGYPVNHDVGPFCPATTADTADAGGIWFDGNGVYDLDGEFVLGLADLYSDSYWKLYDDNGNVNVTETAEEFDLAARPDVDPSLQNHCVEGRIEWLDNGEPVQTTVLIPTTPVKGDSSTQSNGNHGITLNGVVIAASAPVDAILSAYTIAAFDDCGGHINPTDGYHMHGARGCGEVGETVDGETPIFAYAMDGYPIHSPLNATVAAAIDLDECNGHTTEADGYHYHAGNVASNSVLSCLQGATVQTDGGAPGGRGDGPPGDGNDGPPEDEDDSLPTAVPTDVPTAVPTIAPTAIPTIVPEPTVTVVPTQESGIGRLRYVRGSGVVSAFDETFVTIGSTTCAITADTSINGTLAENAKVKLFGTTDGSNTCTALAITVEQSSSRNNTEFDHTGSVRSLSASEIKIGRLTFTINIDTVISKEISVGDEVYVQAEKTGRNTYVATIIEFVESEESEPQTAISMTGLVSNVTDTALTVGNIDFILNEDTTIIGDLVDGANILVKGIGNADSTEIVAQKIKVYKQEESPVFLRGIAENITSDSFAIDESIITIATTTQIVGNFSEGATVFVIADKNADDSFTATSILVKKAANTYQTDIKTVIGIVNNYSDSSFTIRNKTLVIGENSELPETLADDLGVRVTIQVTESGSYEVLLVEVMDKVTGPVQSISDAGMWVNSRWFQFGDGCQFQDHIAVGDLVEISTETENTDFELSPLMRAATEETSTDTALYILPTTAAPTSVSFSDAGIAPASNLAILIVGLLVLVLLVVGLTVRNRLKY